MIFNQLSSGLIIAAGCIVTLCIAIGIVNFQLPMMLFLIGLILMIFFVKKPELALAIHYNGQLFYYLLLYYAGIAPYTTLTGGFHLFIGICYLTGGIIIVFRCGNLSFNMLDWLVSCFFLYIIFNFLFLAFDVSVSRTKLSFLPLLAAAPFYGIQILYHDKNRIEKFIYYSGLFPVILAIPLTQLLLQSSSAHFYIQFESISTYAIATGSYQAIGIAYSIGLIIVIMKFPDLKNKFGKIFCYSLSAFFLFIILRTGSRGSIVSIATTLCLYPVFLEQSIGRRIVFIITAVITLIAGITMLPEETLDYYTRTLSLESQAVKAIDARFFSYEITLDAFYNNPIWGSGFGNISSEGHWAHNVFIEIAGELGIVGLFMFCAICYTVIHYSYKNILLAKNRQHQWLMKTAVLLFFFSLLKLNFSGNITKAGLYFFISVGLISALTKSELMDQKGNGKLWEKK